MFGVILLKLNLTCCYPSCIQLPDYCLYLYYLDGKISHAIFCHQWINDYPDLLRQDVIKEINTYNTMYPRWYTLYLYFKYNNDDVPLDIFTSIIYYYVDINY